jgi:hypothetical protein
VSVVGIHQRCLFCNESIDPMGRYALRQTIGWERKAVGPNRRGGSDIVFRQPLDVWAHGACIALERKGRRGQGSLFS